MSDDKTIIADPSILNPIGSPKRKNACLVQYSGLKLGKRYPVKDSVSIVGRSPSVQVVISEASVSRQHAKLILVGDNVAVEDMGSANGTFINDAPVKQATQLRDGDIVRLGTVLLKFFAHDNVDSVMHDKI